MTWDCTLGLGLVFGIDLQSNSAEGTQLSPCFVRPINRSPVRIAGALYLQVTSCENWLNRIVKGNSKEVVPAHWHKAFAGLVVSLPALDSRANQTCT